MQVVNTLWSEWDWICQTTSKSSLAHIVLRSSVQHADIRTRSVTILLWPVTAKSCFLPTTIIPQCSCYSLLHGHGRPQHSISPWQQWPQLTDIVKQISAYSEVFHAVFFVKRPQNNTLPPLITLLSHPQRPATEPQIKFSHLFCLLLTEKRADNLFLDRENSRVGCTEVVFWQLQLICHNSLSVTRSS